MSNQDNMPSVTITTGEVHINIYNEPAEKMLPEQEATNYPPLSPIQSLFGALKGRGARIETIQTNKLTFTAFKGFLKEQRNVNADKLKNPAITIQEEIYRKNVQARILSVLELVEIIMEEVKHWNNREQSSGN